MSITMFMLGIQGRPLSLGLQGKGLKNSLVAQTSLA